MTDYLVVGLGLAGISFCEQLKKHNRTFKVLSDSSQSSSMVAGGLYNPVILKRFTLAWRAKEQMDLAAIFYTHLEKKLQVTIDYKVPVLRRFASVEEQNLWYEALDKPSLEYFLSPKIIPNKNPCLSATLGFGEVLYTGRVDTSLLIRAYSRYLADQEELVPESFDYSQLEIQSDFFQYGGHTFKNLVFAEGFGLKKNPFFNYLPLNGTKGELLTIKAEGLQEDRVIKSSVFIIPLQDDMYRVGATYNWKDKESEPTENGKQELLRKLKTFINCDFEVMNHSAGIRPTVADRRPLVGRHPEYKNLFVLNGLGSRGVLIAPYASEQLYNLIEFDRSLNPEMDIARFSKKWIK
ncbi:NAD(P)/FAD-dependent oxidoreductase [Pareuzebyella sediminis]|uniref:NAD(P)/FAD-dependent oxidoreductase n=1 Tax=Pareuzebyella sediminis TaxID=2607998 RepID=UPI0011EDDDAA|nr:FAD-dependent oxidoreductase [Pareuzebyella sediminis]